MVFVGLVIDDDELKGGRCVVGVKFSLWMSCCCFLVGRGDDVGV